MKKAVLFSIVLVIIHLKGLAQTITATSGFNTSLPATSVSEAGSNYSTTATSAVNQTLISLRAAAGVFTFTISVHKIDTDWNSGLSVWVQRTGTGTGGGTLSTTGGSTYQQITNSSQFFFSGVLGTNRRRNNIPIQYQIRGASVLLPVKTYTTTVVYTISN